ncbi:hypothetical protein F5Y18DRAFT_21661 [Xylariaceae sp. FL1019]|nr:hypothetical protein F5Y18DRAFT_21661 [Xylariaceae sp. FL1019]
MLEYIATSPVSSHPVDATPRGHRDTVTNDTSGGPRPDISSDIASGGGQAQTLWILIFKGHPRDIQSTRVTELYLAFNESESINVTFSLRGQYPSFRVREVWNGPMPRHRRNFHRRLAVSTIMSTEKELNMCVRDAISDTPANNSEPDLTSQSWVGDMITVLQEADLVTVEEGDNALNGMVNYISQAPWQ